VSQASSLSACSRSQWGPFSLRDLSERKRGAGIYRRRFGSGFDGKGLASCKFIISLGTYPRTAQRIAAIEIHWNQQSPYNTTRDLQRRCEESCIDSTIWNFVLPQAFYIKLLNYECIKRMEAYGNWRIGE
jgi:hypothetical protein